MDLASVVAALASVGVRVSGSTPNNNIQEDSSRACPTGLAGPEPFGTHNDPGQHFHMFEHPEVEAFVWAILRGGPHKTLGVAGGLCALRIVFPAMLPEIWPNLGLRLLGHTMAL